MGSPDFLNTEQVGFLHGGVTMGRVGSYLELPQRMSCSVGPFSSLIQAEHLFLLGLTSSHNGPGFWVEENRGVPPMKSPPHLPLRGGLEAYSVEKGRRLKVSERPSPWASL